MRRSYTMVRKGQEGFSILEMMIATIILLVGIVGVAQLVPASILLNQKNRTDSSALVFAQRELDQMLDQPLSANAFTDTQGNFCSLGNPATTNAPQGNPVLIINSQAFIDFGASTGVPNYSFTYQDPSDPNGSTYDVRWAVIITGDGTTVSAKRFILGVRQQGGSGFVLPITVDTVVER